MRRTCFTIMAAFAAVAQAACAPAAPTRAERTGAAPTFVSLNPCLDALLVEIAEDEQVLALSHYSRDASSSSLDPGTVEHFGTTGGTAEEVLALEPDIVLASSFIDPATRSALEGLGLQVETFGSPTGIRESLSQVERIAALAGREEAGRALAKRIESSAPRGPQREIATLLWQPGQIVPGEATLIGELMAESGLASHSAARGLGQADHVALETLLADPPELLLVAGESKGQEHPLLSALGSTRVERLPAHLIYCGGPTIADVRTYFAQVRESMGEAGKERTEP